MRKILFIVACVVLSGCSSSITSPTLDPMETWAVAHAHEICVNVDGHGVLHPISEYFLYINSLAPISFCNPAESRTK